jgi:hypothetical protein
VDEKYGAEAKSLLATLMSVVLQAQRDSVTGEEYFEVKRG